MPSYGEEITRVYLGHDEGVVTARQRTRDIAELVGFDRLEQTRVATAVSELARNARRYAGGGEVRIRCGPDRLQIDVIDEGPGIPNLDEVLSGAYVSSTGMGRGLIGVRLMMDEFEISAPAGRGTRVTVAKRLPAGAPVPSPRALRDELSKRGARSPFDEVSRQNEELLQALGEVRRRQQEMVALNRELEETNQGVVALYAELDDRAERLVEADERKSRFLADMSHELRTPLNSIIALSELLLSGEPALVGEQMTQVSFIRRVAEDQLRLIGDLLDIAKIEAGRLELDLTDTHGRRAVRDPARPAAPAAARRRRRAALRHPGRADRAAHRRGQADADHPQPRLQRVEVHAAAARSSCARTREGERAAPRGLRHRHRDRAPEPHADLRGVRPDPRRAAARGPRHGARPAAHAQARRAAGRRDRRAQRGRRRDDVHGHPAAQRVGGRGSLPDLTGAVLVVDDDEAARYVVETHLRGTAWRTVAADGGAAALAALTA